ncbi:MAG TPA: hypothetical protein VK525_13050, partial [Candidatus Saccharimonadales bacterium]|nr:hypothetical protein [Candidatus Saccharimonadales bacterium]
MIDFSQGSRRAFIQGVAATAAVSSAAVSLPRSLFAASADMDVVRAEIKKRHDEALKRLQNWIQHPSIAAENRSMNEGCELMMGMLAEAGFSGITKMPTDGHPGVFATLD